MTRHGLKPRPLANRFWEKVDRREPDECWEWMGCKIRGYGQIGKGGKYGKTLLTHRVSWEIHYGPIPEGMCVCHDCDNPGCVNPAHLWLGTIADNVRDQVQKGRQARGETIGISKLTKPQVRTIRYLLDIGYKQKDIAQIYNVAPTTISQIKLGKRWGWLK